MYTSLEDKKVTQIKAKGAKRFVWSHFSFLWSVTTADTEWLSQVRQLTLKPLNLVTQQKIYSENQDMSQKHSCVSQDGLTLESAS